MSISIEVGGKQYALARSLGSIAGSEHVTTDASFSISGQRPEVVVKPGSPGEVAECLGVCAERGAAVIPAGLMGWLENGNPVRRADVVLSTERMSRILDYSPPDLTVTVEAGVTIGELNAATGRERQWLPLDPPGGPQATLGAIAATASSGALRAGFGTMRDYCIGLKLAHADGTQSKSGGRVVKNVAGYDLNKLYVGSYGTLAVLTELTVKLRPLPERFATLAIEAAGSAELARTAERLRDSEVQPVSLILTKSVSPSHKGLLLLARYADSSSAVEHQLSVTRRIAATEGAARPLSDEVAEALWDGVNNIDRLPSTAFRLSVPLSKTAAMLNHAMKAAPDGLLTADFGAGIIRVAFDATVDEAIRLARSMRDVAAQTGGTLFIERAELAVRERVDTWSGVGHTLPLMRSIKSRFDPQSILNPGRFVERL